MESIQYSKDCIEKMDRATEFFRRVHPIVIRAIRRTRRMQIGAETSVNEAANKITIFHRQTTIRHRMSHVEVMCSLLGLSMKIALIGAPGLLQPSLDQLAIALKARMIAKPRRKANLSVTKIQQVH